MGPSRLLCALELVVWNNFIKKLNLARWLGCIGARKRLLYYSHWCWRYPRAIGTRTAPLGGSIWRSGKRGCSDSRAQIIMMTPAGYNECEPNSTNGYMLMACRVRSQLAWLTARLPASQPAS